MISLKRSNEPIASGCNAVKKLQPPELAGAKQTMPSNRLQVLPVGEMAKSLMLHTSANVLC
jgi:hypothetical protein